MTTKPKTWMVMLYGALLTTWSVGHYGLLSLSLKKLLSYGTLKGVSRNTEVLSVLVGMLFILVAMFMTCQTMIKLWRKLGVEYGIRQALERKARVSEVNEQFGECQRKCHILIIIGFPLYLAVILVNAAVRLPALQYAVNITMALFYAIYIGMFVALIILRYQHRVAEDYEIVISSRRPFDDDSPEDPENDQNIYRTVRVARDIY